MKSAKELRVRLDAAIYNKHGGGSVSSRWTVDSILDTIMPIIAARDAEHAQERERLEKLPGEDAWLDEFINCDGHRGKLTTVLRAYAANIRTRNAEREQAAVAAALRDAANHYPVPIQIRRVGETPVLCLCGHVLKTDYRLIEPTIHNAHVAHLVSFIQPSQQSVLDKILEIAEQEGFRKRSGDIADALADNGIDWKLGEPLADCINRALAEATMEEHANHVQFFNDLYARLFDPVAEGEIKEAKLMEELLASARWYRQHVHDLEGQLNNLPKLLAEAKAEMRQRLASWLEERCRWFKAEIEAGGNYIHLSTRREEASYIAEKARALPLDAPERQ